MDHTPGPFRSSGNPSRRRGTRWGPYGQRGSLVGLPCAITGPLTDEQKDAYVLYLRIGEINQQLASKDALPTNRARSASPPPEYDASGRRINTREQRYRARLEAERRYLIDRAVATIPGYRAPSDYYRQRATYRLEEKVYIPATDYPSVNFIGQILGPRGNSLRAMSEDSGATIVIRGRGSIKGGRNRAPRASDTTRQHEHEPLHCVITADTQDKVDKAKKLINAVIETVTSTPEFENERKRSQLRELAMINGTFRDDEGCHRSNSRLLVGEDATAATAYATRTLGGKPDATGSNDTDQQYRQLMKELGEDGGYQCADSLELHTITHTKLPPWRAAGRK